MNKKRITIYSVPRSETTWLGKIINSFLKIIYKYQPLFSYEFKDFFSDNFELTEINEFFEKLDKTRFSFLDQEKSKNKGIIPVFKKNKITHIIYKEVRYYYIIKNLFLKDYEIKFIDEIQSELKNTQLEKYLMI